MNGRTPFLRPLSFTITANVRCGHLQGVAKFLRDRAPCLFEFDCRDAQRIIGSYPVPFFGIATQSCIAILAHLFNNAAHLLFHFAEASRAPLFKLAYQGLGALTTQHSHHKTTLFSGYSTIPSALAALSCGMIFHAVVSSIMVFTATHSASLSAEMVGFCSAGNTARTPSKSILRTLSIKPTRP